MHSFSPITVAAATILFAGIASADERSTDPADGLRENTPDAYALKAARVVTSPGAAIERAVVIVRHGRIVDVGRDVRVPKDARVIDLGDNTIYPGLIDAFSEQSIDSDQLQSNANYWNRLVRPEMRIVDQYERDDSDDDAYRKQGVTARLLAPRGGVIRGMSAVVLTGGGELNESLVRSDVALHMRLTVPRRSEDRSYPNSPMGAVALARQALYDADWYRKALQASELDPTLPRPERNTSLAALQPALAATTPVVIDTSNELFALRADRFAREFGLNLIVRGSGNEYRQLDALRALNRPILVPVDFPTPPNVSTAEIARGVTLESLMHWDIAPENPGRLNAAGVPIALCSYGLSSKGDLLKQVRRAVTRGLSADAALRALTVTPATLFGVDSELGTIERGRMANLVVADGDLFASKTKVVETWVAGERFEHQSDPLRDAAGQWLIKATNHGELPATLHLAVERTDEKLTATIRRPDDKPDDAVELSRVALDDTRLSGTFVADDLGADGVARFTLVIDDVDSSDASGHVVWPDGTRVAVTASRADKPVDKAEPASDKKAEDKEIKDVKASFAVNFPLGAFGRSETPARPKRVLFRGATVWTCGPKGTLKKADVLIGNGRILAVGKRIRPPRDVVIVNAKGLHLSPGIIDCHSHMATDGGVNESGQGITAEVRIGDFIDSDDITIYRQLAGGVTTSNILHGSANPIGGQNQVIKLRWGALPEQMKFKEAPQGIKFALGENVKQSNWGDDYTTRYPQTRMGVEQLFRDELQAAREYQQRRDDWDANHRGLPPRRDLELDAIAEILAGTRWIHCHSYRQDEILALIRVLDDHDITIGTFQHILEGYKVADAMAKHGAMGSAFSDWWAYKFEVYDAIPFAGALMHDAGVVVSFNSDDRELARHLNQEAAKAVKYGGVEPVEALKFVTLNPALQLRIDQHVGSIEKGKHADLVLWSAPPLSNFARCEQTWIDGRKYFDRADDQQVRATVRDMRNTLIQKILASGESMRRPGEGDGDPASLWPRHDEFCHGHEHGDHGHDE